MADVKVLRGTRGRTLRPPPPDTHTPPPSLPRALALPQIVLNNSVADAGADAARLHRMRLEQAYQVLAAQLRHATQALHEAASRRPYSQELRAEMDAWMVAVRNLTAQAQEALAALLP